MSPFKDNTLIQMRLLRSSNIKEDDRIALRRVDDDLYALYYRDGQLLNKKNLYVCELTGEQVDTYFQSLFALLSRDRDPFTQIQITPPCFPSVLYNIDDLDCRCLRQKILDLLPILQESSRIR